MTHPVCVYLGDALAAYNFGASHAFGPHRHSAFANAFYAQNQDKQVEVLAPVMGSEDQLRRFHTAEYIEKVKSLSQLGHGMLDCGDTPVFAGMYEAALTVVGTTLDAVRRVMLGEYRRAFIPIAGLHHARRDSAAGFCIFNDCGIAIEQLLHQFGVMQVAYIDIDAHHGDGVYYSFDENPAVCVVDLHEDGRYLYPGTGSASERGRGPGKGNKLNIPMPPYANDTQFMQAWQDVEDAVRSARPDFILFQCGADSLRGDPITHLHYSEQAHAHAATRLCALADELCEGRLVVMGGGGYKLDNIARAWVAVVASLISHTPDTGVTPRISDK
ncbi:MAG: acetoin utilization protein AcuC [Gammaproteobacteria bacterium]|jgi:acetoin utilization protein AcuC